MAKKGAVQTQGTFVPSKKQKETAVAVTPGTAESEYSFTPYDVLQIEQPDGENQVGKWVDFATLRSTQDATDALRLVREQRWNGRPARFRITRFLPGYGLSEIYPLPVSGVSQ